jgi:hypothetical protein
LLVSSSLALPMILFFSFPIIVFWNREVTREIRFHPQIFFSIMMHQYLDIPFQL